MNIRSIRTLGGYLLAFACLTVAEYFLGILIVQRSLKHSVLSGKRQVALVTDKCAMVNKFIWSC
jgi:hypothetical protein